MAKKQYRIRFHLQKGEHFQHWQIKDCDSGEVLFFDPATHLIHAEGCRLRNQPATANKIFQGADKTVCAWVDADRIHVTNTGRHGYNAEYEANLRGTNPPKVSYNPKVSPNWRNASGDNIDGATFRELMFCNRSVFVSIP